MYIFWQWTTVASQVIRKHLKFFQVRVHPPKAISSFELQIELIRIHLLIIFFLFFEIEELLSLHRGQGFDIYWRDNLKCPSESEYMDMVSASMTLSLLFFTFFTLGLTFLSLLESRPLLIINFSQKREDYFGQRYDLCKHLVRIRGTHLQFLSLVPLANFSFLLQRFHPTCK